MSISESKQDNKLFIYAIGLALGIVVGFALGAWTMYAQSLKYAAASVETFIKNAPIDCQASLGYGNHSLQLVLPGFNLSNNGSVIWTKQ